MDYKWMIYGLASLAVAYIVLSVMDLVVTGIGLPASLNASYSEFMDKAGLATKIGVFGLIMLIVWSFFVYFQGPKVAG